NREIAGQGFGALVQVLNRLLDRGGRRPRPMLAGVNVGGQLGTGPTEGKRPAKHWVCCGQGGHTDVGTEQRRGWQTPLSKRINQLAAIYGHIRQDFVPDPCYWVDAGCGPHTPVQCGYNFAKGLSDMEL